MKTLLGLTIIVLFSTMPLLADVQIRVLDEANQPLGAAELYVYDVAQKRTLQFSYSGDNVRLPLPVGEYRIYAASRLVEADHVARLTSDETRFLVTDVATAAVVLRTRRYLSETEDLELVRKIGLNPTTPR